MEVKGLHLQLDLLFVGSFIIANCSKQEGNDLTVLLKKLRIFITN